MGGSMRNFYVSICVREKFDGAVPGGLERGWGKVRLRK